MSTQEFPKFPISGFAEKAADDIVRQVATGNMTAVEAIKRLAELIRGDSTIQSSLGRLRRVTDDEAVELAVNLYAQRAVKLVKPKAPPRIRLPKIGPGGSLGMILATTLAEALLGELLES